MILLVLAGSKKLVDPAPTVGALRSAGWPSAGPLVRLLGAVEMGVAGWFLVAGGPVPAILGALLYAGFAVFVGRALVRDVPISSCGCLGSRDTPPSVSHAVVNLFAVGVLTAGAIIPVAPLGGLVGQGMDVVVPQTIFIGAVPFLLYGILTVLPLVGKRAVRASDPLPMPGRRA